MTCNNLTSVLEQDDLLSIIAAIKIQNDRRARERQSGLKGNFDVDAIGQQESIKEHEKEKKEAEPKVQMMNIVEQNQKMIKQNAILSN